MSEEEVVGEEFEREEFVEEEFMGKRFVLNLPPLAECRSTFFDYLPKEILF
ncbi:hypothetical protein Q7267_07095 [Glaesserella parasuis]|uniref:hypothetical protein n=1 Tax=Glaesserella parasuis TaxID=738 RepID=UPI0013654DF7|nr:hypothetical protein [Glaesserella parasuis]MDG6828595.1 hypothetical protein [Glaesserella parasuis]MDO9758393.1 hypothetical protein [Glaesserella parasuis]MDO9926809.1 hypothetical protein [Glaesserella parasuis]MDO9930965.1 hypothetical protein [Glaesserella parasuis]MDP0020594.1 hypothetical protein [Glaesserella parasuis]